MVAARSPVDQSGRTRWLPSLIAVPYGLVDAQQPSAQSKWSVARATAQATAQYIAYLVLAPLSGETVEQRFAALRTAFNTEQPVINPTLGHFIAIINTRREIVRATLPRVALSLWKKRGARTELGVFMFERLTKLRNSDAHGGALPEREYEAMYQELRPMLDNLLTALSEDSTTVVPIVQHEMDVADGERFHYLLSELRGGAIALPTTSLVSGKRLKREQVYWSMPNDEFRDADPLMVFRACPTCGMQEAFLLDHFDPAAPRWRNARGHEIRR